MDTITSPQADRASGVCARLGRMLEAAVDTLPETYRTVFMRDIEGLSTARPAGLGLGRKRSRHACRARAMIHRAVTRRSARWPRLVPVPRPALRRVVATSGRD